MSGGIYITWSGMVDALVWRAPAILFWVTMFALFVWPTLRRWLERAAKWVGGGK